MQIEKNFRAENWFPLNQFYIFYIFKLTIEGPGQQSNRHIWWARQCEWRKEQNKQLLKQDNKDWIKPQNSDISKTEENGYNIRQLSFSIGKLI